MEKDLKYNRRAIEHSEEGLALLSYNQLLKIMKITTVILQSWIPAGKVRLYKCLECSKIYCLLTNYKSYLCPIVYSIALKHKSAMPAI